MAVECLLCGAFLPCVLTHARTHTHTHAHTRTHTNTHTHTHNHGDVLRLTFNRLRNAPCGPVSPPEQKTIYCLKYSLKYCLNYSLMPLCGFPRHMLTNWNIRVYCIAFMRFPSRLPHSATPTPRSHLDLLWIAKWRHTKHVSRMGMMGNWVWLYNCSFYAQTRTQWQAFGKYENRSDLGQCSPAFGQVLTSLYQY